MLLYFQKNSTKPKLEYGSQLILHTKLQPITNSGNPGGFDYKRYCSFQHIHYQSFLKPEDYTIVAGKQTKWFKNFLITSRQSVLETLRKYIKQKRELSVAEALLIGYRDDLDIELVQSYSNAGVVHIIAISGLHLGMIYGALVLLFKRFRSKKWHKFVQPVTILLVLWLFTFIAGSVPSILRSAVMFTCIVLGESLTKRTSIYNTLAATAFILLVIDPFYLWDVGFQLSFAAVISIIAFQHYINNWFYFQNKLMKRLWQLSAITLSAQVLTLPIVLYHFHQFPNFFMFTNLIIVPLSGLILFAELFLLIISFIPLIAEPFGKAVEWLLWLMNTFIERTDRIPYSVTDGIQITIPQAIFIMAAIVFASVWLIRKNRLMFYWATGSLLCYVGLRSIDIIKVNQQQKIIVYNVPKHRAIDVVEGDTYTFIGDSVLLQEGFLRNFHLKPSRIVNRMDMGLLNSVSIQNSVISSHNRKAIIVDKSLPYDDPRQKIQADVLIISQNPKLYISQLMKHYEFKMLVFDATNPLWKIRLWKKDCDSLHLPHHSVPEQGAFEMDL
jgi:competence protein ComEC